MFNVINNSLAFFHIRGGGLILNKTGKYVNFVYLLTLLTIWILSYTTMVQKSCSGTMRLLNVLLTVRVLIAIKTKALLLFYVFFEFRVIPITLIIFLYGYQPEKIQASLALLIYTAARGLPLLLYIIVCDITYTYSIIASLPITLGFIVKTPMYVLHT